jgi:hypothetical protein
MAVPLTSPPLSLTPSASPSLPIPSASPIASSASATPRILDRSAAEDVRIHLSGLAPTPTLSRKDDRTDPRAAAPPILRAHNAFAVEAAKSQHARSSSFPIQLPLERRRGEDDKRKGKDAGSDQVYVGEWAKLLSFV